MKNFKYFIQYILIIFLLLLFKIIGHKYSLIISSKLFSFIGPFFRSKKINASIITTEKDYVKLSEADKKEIKYLEISLEIKNEKKLIELIKKSNEKY